MSYAPASIAAAANYCVGRGWQNDGIVGSLTTHKGGYHLGRDRIYSDCAAKPGGVCVAGQYDADYSVRTARDKAGLTDGAAAFDIARGSHALSELQAFSRWLVAECRAGAPDTLDVREVIYSPDGTNVYRWDRERGVDSAPYTPGGDATHLWHTHISWYRDAEARDKTAVFRRYFEAGMEEPDMVITRGKFERWTPTLTNGQSNGVLRAAPDRSSPIVKRLAPGEVLETAGEVVAASQSWRVRYEPDGSVLYALRTDWNPQVAGGDPAYNASVFAAMYGTAPTYTISYNEGVDAAAAAALTAKKK